LGLKIKLDETRRLAPVTKGDTVKAKRKKPVEFPLRSL
jgi:hypothetical protein